MIDTKWKRQLRSVIWGVLASATTSLSFGQVTVPVNLVGRYDLTMQASTAASPIKDGVSVVLELSQDGTLCVDGLHFTSPVQQAGNPASITWTSSTLGLKFTTNPGSAFALGLSSDSGTAYGILSGKRVADTTAACGKTAFSASIEDFFVFAEATYTDLFPASPFVFTRSDTTSSYRYYPGTTTYLSVASNGTVQARGGKFGSSPRTLGTLSSIWANPDQHDFRDYLTDIQPTTTLGSYYVGTYTLSLDEAAPFSPIPSGTALTFTVTDSLQLCVGETVLSPALEQPPSMGQPAEETNSRDLPLVWKNPMTGDYYRMVLVPEEEKFTRQGEGAFEFISSTGFRYGRFTGDRTSLSTDCGAYMDQPDVAQVELLFDLAEQHYAALFPGGAQTFSQQVNGSIVREYLQSGVTVRILNEVVFAKGGAFGSAEIRLGKLANLIAAMRSQSIASSVPAMLEGTYTVDFSAAGAHVGIPSQTGLDLALYQDGRLCMDGVVLLQPMVDPQNPAITRWNSSEGGFSLLLDTSALAGDAVELSMLSASGLVLGEVSGSKSSSVPACNGELFSGVGLDDVELMFELAEQVMPAQFPASALTYTRLQDEKLLRYYPSTQVLVTVDQAGVTISGGPFGAQGQAAGSVAQVLAMLLKDNGGQPVGISTTLTVSGYVITELGGMSGWIKEVDITSDNAALPAGQSTAELIPFIQQALGNELSGSSEFNVQNVSFSSSVIEFDVQINNRVKTPLSTATRSYTLNFRYDIGS